MARARACLGFFGNQISKIAAPDARNYQSSFAGSGLLFTTSLIAYLSDSNFLFYATFMFASGMGAVGARQYNAVLSQSKPGKAEFADAREESEESSAGMKKTQ